MGADGLGSEVALYFDVVVETEDDGAAAILQRYWAAELGLTGQVSFHEHVKEIAEALGVQTADVSRLARASGFATHAGEVCLGCGRLWQRRTRSDRPDRWSRCELCKEEHVRAREEQAAAADHQRATRRECLDRYLSSGDLDGPGVASIEAPDCWAFSDVVDLLSWLLLTGPSGVIVPEREHDLRLAATGGIEVRLWRLGVLGIDPSTDADAFDWEESPDDGLPPQFFVDRARFFLRGTGPLRQRVDAAILRLESVLTAAWRQSWVEEACAYAGSVLAGEALRYLDHAVGKHGLPSLDREQASRFDEMAQDALRSYSLGECYSQLWRAAKDGAAATKRHPMSLADGTSHAINQFERNISWARKNKWDLQEYSPDRALPFAWQTQVLFERVLELDVISAQAREIEAIARDRLGDEETVRRQLAEGIPEARASEGIDRFSALRYDVEDVDLILDAMRATAEAVLLAGGSPSDALRAAYFSVDALRVVADEAAETLDLAQSLLADVVRG